VANPDLAAATEAGAFGSGAEHFAKLGKLEGHGLRQTKPREAMRAEKKSRVVPLLRLDMPGIRCGLKFDCRTEALRVET
jgi:hypothetical protein